MKKTTGNREKTIDFSKGVRGKYARMDLVVVGATPDPEPTNADVVLKKVLRVLNSAGPSKRELEVAVDRARNLIESTQHP